jgi:cold shock CspA family protein
MSSSRFQGVVKWFNHQRGFGFISSIEPDCGHTDVFVHHTKLDTKKPTYKTLYKGEYVEYAVETDSSGKNCASSVTGIRGLALMCEANQESRGGPSPDDNTEES